MTLISDITSEGMGKLRLTYQYVFFGIVTAMLGAMLMLPNAEAISTGVYWTLVILEFIVLFVFMYFKNMITYLIFTLLTGITLVPILAHMIGIGASAAIVQALIATATITGGLTYYAATTDKNYLGMGQVLFWILLGLIVMMIANIFIASSLLANGLSMVAVVLFSFFIIYDTQTVLHTNITPLEGALSIYLDILNLFTSLLNLLSGDD